MQVGTDFGATAALPETESATGVAGDEMFVPTTRDHQWQLDQLDFQQSRSRKPAEP